MRNVARLFLACTVLAPLGALAAITAPVDLAVTASVKASCSVNAASINFPAYDPIADDSASRSAQTDLSITCTKGHGANIALGIGANHDGTSRRMKNVLSADFIAYGLYQDATMTIPWGSTIGTDTASYVGKGKTADTTSVTVYAMIGAGQDAVAGDYADTVTITINY
jgi:spore coat protein U-like protein